jgi:hypothetical protein
MFVVDEETAAAIRSAQDRGGELSAVVELRRHFQGSPTMSTRGPAFGPSPTGSRCPRSCLVPAGCAVMSDQVITAEMAATLHQRALDLGAMTVWVISTAEPDHPGVLVARLITQVATPYALTAATLPELRGKLPPGLVRSERQPADPKNVVEVWVCEA